jgi:iron-sulfur cluster assembly protein
MLSMTPEAAEIVKEATSSEGVPESAGLRITAVDEEGEATIELTLADGPDEGDDVVEGNGGARVFLDSYASELLSDKVLGAHRHDDHVHFTIDDQPDASPES